MCDCSFHTRTQEPYAFLLERREWKAKRDHILIRDDHRCQRCGATEGPGISMHVHHMHYIQGLDPWEYKDSELVTLCEDCHQYVHETEHVPEYRLRDGLLEEVTLTPCRRCGGAGYFREYRHVQGGICFRCLGSRYEERVAMVQQYIIEHDIEISDLQAGFYPLPSETKEKIESAVISKSASEKLYITITMKDGKIRRAFPDYSMTVACGDALEIESLMWKNRKFKDSQDNYVVFKGKIKKL